MLTHPFDRRRFLEQSGWLLGAHLIGNHSAYCATPQFNSDPFSLGIASGDPLPNGVVLWTRLAPDPLNGGGMPNENVSVEWQVASDEGMGKIVRRGTAIAAPGMAHSVHVEVDGLDPARWYWYSFKAGAAVSPVGRTRTTPAVRSRLDRLNFAFASCQHYETGLFTAYRHMAEEDLDLVVHLGDYIYESAGREDRVRKHTGAEIESLADYRNRHALYKTDPDLRKVHALFPWIVTWDDHELDNNYAGDVPEDKTPRAAFLERRANAYQAYYEHMPLRRSSLPKGSEMLLYRRLTFGDLAEFAVLDTRQYRTDQPCGDGRKAPCAEALDPKATLLGPKQEGWLLGGLGRSRARWNILAQQVMMAPVNRVPVPGESYSMDQWAGYPAARTRLLSYLLKRKPSNPIVITGDIHANWVADLKADFREEESATVGTEFVGTSISSGGDGSDTSPSVEKILPENPHVKFFNQQRGYVRCGLTRDRLVSDYRVVSYVTRPDSPIATRASFVVENGRAGVQKA
ncbi:MAG: alkaline phosphatase D family protein [Bryobacteraceae bacterium]